MLAQGEDLRRLTLFRMPAPIPFPVSSFIGRARELRDLTRAVAAERLVTILGPGGSGKTRVALEFARARARRVGDVFAVVDLSAISDPLLVGSTIARALGADEPPAAQALAHAASLIGVRSGLLVMDGCEHLVDACASAATDLLSAAPGLRLLVTSRQRLGVPGETVWALPPLEHAEARALFLERAGQRRRGMVAPDAVIDRICGRLDGLPLAIELAASRAGGLTVEEIDERLGERLGLLSDVSRRDRHRTMRSTIEWSYTLLDDAGRAFFRRLAVFDAAPDLEAVAAVCGGDALDVLSRLIDRSLVQPRAAGTRTRYAMLDTIREFGRAELQRTGESDAMRSRHLAHFVARTEAAFDERLRTGRAEKLYDLDSDLENIRAALAWAAARDACSGLRIIAATRELWFRRGQAEGLRRARELLAGCGEVNATRGWALLTAGNLALTQLEHDAADRDLEEASALGRRFGEPRIEAWGAWMRGVDLFLAQRFAEARVLLMKSISLQRGTGDDIGLGMALASLGTVQVVTDERETAVASLEEALELLSGVNDLWGMGFCHTYLGIARRRNGESDAARRHFERGVDLLERVRDVTMLTLCLAGLAQLAANGRDWRRALRLAGAASGLRERVGGPFPPWVAQEVEDLRAGGTAALHEEAGQRAWEAGRALSLEGAVALAHGRVAASGAGPLSPRELQVARLVARGLSNDGVAAELGLSRRTVENHLLHISGKLGLENRTQVAAWLLRRSSSD